jgi:energy-coupling factor transport system ATP-binding protein
MIELDRISVSLPPNRPDAKVILRDITISINIGEWVALTGPNGSGKSTLLRALAGLHPLREGAIRFAGDAPRMALLLQEPDNQFVASSVANELELSPPAGLTKTDRRSRVAEAVKRFGLGGFLERNPHRLSGGEKQRLALATVWLAEPAVFLLDEPTSFLDPFERERCVEFAGSMSEQGAVVVWATPGGDDLPHADRVVCLDRGKVVHDGPAGSINEWIAAAGADIIPAGAWDALGPDAEPRRSAGVKPSTDRVVVALRDVGFSFGPNAVFGGVNAEIASGDVLGVSGGNGSGKSTLLSLIAGVLEPSAGTVERLFSTPLIDGAPGTRAEQAVFYMFQSPERLFFAETVREELAFGLKSLGVGDAEAGPIIEDALGLVGLDPAEFSSRAPLELSLGEMRRVAFAIARTLRPRLLLLDEPNSCLDRRGLEALARLIDDMSDAGCAVVMASHDTRVLRGMTRRLINVDDYLPV